MPPERSRSPRRCASRSSRNPPLPVWRWCWQDRDGGCARCEDERAAQREAGRERDRADVGEAQRRYPPTANSYVRNALDATVTATRQLRPRVRTQVAASPHPRRSPGVYGLARSRTGCFFSERAREALVDAGSALAAGTDASPAGGAAADTAAGAAAAAASSSLIARSTTRVSPSKSVELAASPVTPKDRPPSE